MFIFNRGSISHLSCSCSLYNSLVLLQQRKTCMHSSIMGFTVSFYVDTSVTHLTFPLTHLELNVPFDHNTLSVLGKLSPHSHYCKESLNTHCKSSCVIGSFFKLYFTGFLHCQFVIIIPMVLLCSCV